MMDDFQRQVPGFTPKFGASEPLSQAQMNDQFREMSGDAAKSSLHAVHGGHAPVSWQERRRDSADLVGVPSTEESRKDLGYVRSRGHTINFRLIVYSYIKSSNSSPMAFCAASTSSRACWSSALRSDFGIMEVMSRTDCLSPFSVTGSDMISETASMPPSMLSILVTRSATLASTG